MTRPATPRVGLFVEGAPSTDIEGSARLRDLWCDLVRRTVRLAAVPPDRLFVYGFSKGQLTVLSPLYPVGAVKPSADPLDVLVERMVVQDSLTHVVVAFDERPPNQFLPNACMRAEVDVVLEALANRSTLASHIRTDAAAVRIHYAKPPPRIPRGQGHPPRKCVDVIFMRPEFEGMLVCDDAALRHALDVTRKPAGWPKLPGAKPKDTLQKALSALSAQQFRKFAGKAGGGRFHSNPHGWARVIVQNAPDRLFGHEIPRRVDEVLGDLVR